MSSTGYILNGVYVRAKDVPATAKTPRKQVLHKQFEIEADRERFARDLVQPYLPNGQVNEEFVRALPKEAERYGFVNRENKNARRQKK
jgi:hypothetical protein